MMQREDENYGVVMKPAGFPMEDVKFGMDGGQRRALRDIRNNIVDGAGLLHRCAASKRDMTRKSEMEDKNTKRVAAHRPMTRSFAASLENLPQPSQQGSGARHGAIGCERQQKTLASGQISDPILIDEDDLPLPMIEEIEDMINGELKEVEMEDIEEQHLPDIDSCDAKDPLAVVDYVENIYDFYRQTEDVGCVSPDYMSMQSDINEKMRAILIDWLIEVHYKFELMDQTLFLTVNIIDRFLARQSVVRKKLQLVGVTAMFLACKYEEVSVPVVDDLILISDRAYTRAEVLEMERLIVKTLQFNFSVPTAYVFMRRFLKAAEYDKKLELLSFFLMELCLVDYRMLKFQPSFLAAAAVYTAQCTLKGFKQWSTSSELHSRYSENQLSSVHAFKVIVPECCTETLFINNVRNLCRECSRMMVEFHQKAGQGKLTAVLRKYSTSKFGCAAKSEPALFLLDAEVQIQA